MAGESTKRKIKYSFKYFFIITIKYSGLASDVILFHGLKGPVLHK